MKQINDINAFVNYAVENIKYIGENIKGLKALKYSEIKPSKTALLIIDMNNGFAKSGALYSENVEELIPGIEELARRCQKAGIKTIAYTDTHTQQSPELCSYPPHCMKGTEESKVVKEINDLDNMIVIEKNSTNGFLAVPFDRLMSEYGLAGTDTFIIVGDCTDICIYQFAVTLKAYFNQSDKNARVIVPANLVDTFDMEGHNSQFMNVIFLNSMISNGVEVVSNIEEE